MHARAESLKANVDRDHEQLFVRFAVAEPVGYSPFQLLTAELMNMVSNRSGIQSARKV
jgi:hypothetical protein